MFALIRPKALARYVDRGCVHCPLRGRDIEVDLCAGCEWLTAIDLRTEPAFVRCRPDAAPATRFAIWP